MTIKKVEVALCPELVTNYGVEDKQVIVVDIYRATSSMVTGLACGIKEIKPCFTVGECTSYREQGYLLAGERNGIQLEGFDIGNSPFSFKDSGLKNTKIAMTTTNGTKAVDVSSGAKEILIGAFLNISALADYCNKSSDDILIVCAGWKGTPSVEDSLFAAEFLEKLIHADISSDSCEHVKGIAVDRLTTCEHAQRLYALDLEKDVEFCVTRDVYKVVPKVYDTGIQLI